jgi:DNA-binding PadR family transcriptional regulator
MLAQFMGVAPEQHWLLRGRRFRHWARRGPGKGFNPFLGMLFSQRGGLLALYVLHLLAEKPRYGNELMQIIHQRTGGRWAANPGAIYPLLATMEEWGMVEGRWEDPVRRTRRIYRLTAKGMQEKERLQELMLPMLQEAVRAMADLCAEMAAAGPASKAGEESAENPPSG